MVALFFALTLLAALGSGLMAGLFFTFSTFAMTAFARLPPAQGIAAMQSINVVILNPLFFAVFFGTAALCLALAILAVMRWPDPGVAWLLAGAVFYLAGSMLVTMVFNVPLNNALAAVDPASEEGARVWAGYLTGWTAWNHVRTVACLAAAAALTIALCLQARVPGSI